MRCTRINEKDKGNKVMKKNFSTFIKIAMMVAAVGFVACGGDDEDEVLGGGGNSSTSATSSSGKRLVSIEIKDSTIYQDLDRPGYLTNTDTAFYIFTYDDQGRISKVEYDNHGTGYSHTSNITYYENRIIKLGGGTTEMILENELIIKKGTYYCEYDNGYIQTMKKSSNDFNFFWSNGNLEKIDTKGAFIEKGEDYIRAYLIFEYTNYDRPSNFFPMDLELVNDIFDYSYFDYDTGLIKNWGKPTKYLLSKICVEGETIETNEWTIKDKLPIKRIRKYFNKLGNTTVKTYYYTWE